jgi:hypothetical protein
VIGGSASQGLLSFWEKQIQGWYLRPRPAGSHGSVGVDDGRIVSHRSARSAG